MLSLRRICQILIILAILTIVILGFHSPLETTFYTFSNSKLPDAFNGYKIVLLTDFHLKEFGDHESVLVQKVADCKPDLILLGGDFIDEKHTSLSPLNDLLKGIHTLAPIYFVSGNHEFDKSTGEPILQYAEMQALFSQYGVQDIDDQTITLIKDSDSIQLTGRKWRSTNPARGLSPADDNTFHLLLFHGGNFFDQLSPYGYDLILSGHTHGGIVRLPFLGGVFSNTGSLFPKYDAGLFHQGSSSIIISRGLGDARIPRFNNPPEIVCITLYQK